MLGDDPDHVLRISAKEGIGIRDVLEASSSDVPPPKGERTQPLQALIFDSHYDAYKGVIAYVRVVERLDQHEDQAAPDGHRRGVRADRDRHLHAAHDDRPRSLSAGEVGYIATGFKTRARVPRRRHDARRAQPGRAPLPGYKPAKPMVFAGIYPTDTDDYPLLRDALEKLQLNDASLTFLAGNIAGAGLRLPRRLPRHVPHGDRPGAAGARV